MQASYQLPQGGSVRVGAERFMAPEALFRPSLLDLESPGIAELVFQCIQVNFQDIQIIIIVYATLYGAFRK